MTLQMLLRLETNPVFTQNFRDLESEEKRWFSTYMDEREPRESVYLPTTSVKSSPSKKPANSVIYRFSSPTFAQDLRGNVQTWSLEDELKVMATVQAYFHVAHKVRKNTVLGVMLA
jgi:hypothetical protein